MKNALGSVTTGNFAPSGLVTKVTQANGGEIDYEYYDNGLLKKMTDPEGNAYLFSYDEAGRITELKGEAGNTNQFQYDTYGNVIAIIDGEGNKTSLSYNSLKQIQSTTDANGNITKYSYDANGNIAKQVDALGNETVYVYDNVNQVIQVIFKGKSPEEDHVYKYGYDALGNLNQVTDAEGNTYTMEYDKVGNLTKLYDAKEQLVLSYEYDQVYNVVEETDAFGNSTTRDYDSMGNCIKKVNANGYAVSYKYLGGQLMSSSVDAMGSTSTATYDSMGNLESFTNPNGGVTSYTYDLNGNMTSESVGDYYKVAYTYNEIGQVATKENAKGQLTSYQYDKAGRLVSLTDELGTVSYTYDGNANVLTVTEEKKDGTKSVITRTYDALNRVKTYTDGAGNTLSYEYDCFGNLASLTYPEGQKVTYQYNKNSKLIQMTDWQGRSTSYSYNENSVLVKTQRPDGTIETRDYDQAGRLSYIVDKKDENIINSYYYGYDAVGNIVSITSQAKADDGQEQTVQGQETSNSAHSIMNSVETVSSKTQLINVQNAQMEYDETNRLIKYNGQTVKYDADGNMIYGPLNDKMTTYIYDCRNRLIQAGDTAYQYDAENYRIGMSKNVGTVDEVQISYVVDSGSGALSQVLKSEEIDKAGNGKVLYYYYGDNHLVAQEEYANVQVDASDDTTFKAVEKTYLLYHYNNVGSTTAITDETGNVKYEYQYSPYGELLEGTYGQVAFLYNGQYGVASDDNGLFYMRARYYNIDMKRFINQDVIIGSIDRSSSLNRYAYVEGNPINYMDPFGLEIFDTSRAHQVIETIINVCTYASIGAIIGSIFCPALTGAATWLVTVSTYITTTLSVVNGILYIIDACTADDREGYYKALINAITNFSAAILGSGAITGKFEPIADLTFTNPSVSSEAAAALDWLLGYLIAYMGFVATDW